MERFFSYLVIQLQRNGSCGFCVMNNTTANLCSVINFTFLGKSCSVILQGEARLHRLFCIERARYYGLLCCRSRFTGLPSRNQTFSSDAETFSKIVSKFPYQYQTLL